MADSAKDTTPGTHPDAVIINDNGSVTTRGGRGFVWVSDEKNGARYDVPAGMLPRAGLTPVPGYPVNYKPRARAPKPAVLLGDLTPTAGRSALRAGPVPAEVAAARAAAASVTGTTGTVPSAGTDDGQDDTGDGQADTAAAGSTTTSTTKAGTAGGKAGDR